LASKEIHLPELGDFKDVAVIDVLVKPGDSVQVDTPLLTLETEKATMDVPSTEAGTIEKVHVQKGSKVSAGGLIATVTTGDTEKQAAPTAPTASKPADTPEAEQTTKAPKSSDAPAAKPQSDVASKPAPAVPCAERAHR